MRVCIDDHQGSEATPMTPEEATFRLGLAFDVSFVKRLVNSQGQQSEVVLTTIPVRGARSESRAVQAAMRRFERAHNLGKWDHLADCYQVNRVESSSGLAPAPN